MAVSLTQMARLLAPGIRKMAVAYGTVPGQWDDVFVRNPDQDPFAAEFRAMCQRAVDENTRCCPVLRPGVLSWE